MRKEELMNLVEIPDLSLSTIMSYDLSDPEVEMR